MMGDTMRDVGYRVRKEWGLGRIRGVVYKVVEPCIQYYRLGYYDQSINQSILSVICIHHAIF